MASVNKVQIIGRLGKDPELKALSSGKSVTNFTVATSDSWSDKSGNKQEKTEWHNITVWGSQAETASQYLKKGSQVYIDGSLQTRSWETPAGEKRYSTEIVARMIQFLDPKKTSDGGQPQQQDAFKSAPAVDDDLPF